MRCGVVWRGEAHARMMHAGRLGSAPAWQVAHSTPARTHHVGPTAGAGADDPRRVTHLEIDANRGDESGRERVIGISEEKAGLTNTWWVGESSVGCGETCLVRGVAMDDELSE